MENSKLSEKEIKEYLITLFNKDKIKKPTTLASCPNEH